MRFPKSKVKKLTSIAEQVEEHGINKTRFAMWGGEKKK